MGGYCGLAILAGVALFLTTGQCQDNCRGQNGQAGVAGSPGRDGIHGAKGDKGEPAVMSGGQVDANSQRNLNGEKGSQGNPGPVGPKGYNGDQGARGQPGQPGRPGTDGRGHGQHSAQQGRSAFSAIRTERSYPSYKKTVTYQKTVVNEPGDFNMVTGQFTCRVPGVYYFTFHSVAKVSMCLQIVSDALEPKKLGFCDYSNRNNEQVLSGGVVLQLATGQKVWLESFKDQQGNTDPQDANEKQIIFNGFLLFSNEE